MLIAHTGAPASTERTGHGVVFEAMTSSDTTAAGDGSGVDAGFVGTGVGVTGVSRRLGAGAIEADGAGLAQEAATIVAITSMIGSDIG
jgi:hypothetical protein